MGQAREKCDFGARVLTRRAAEAVLALAALIGAWSAAPGAAEAPGEEPPPLLTPDRIRADTVVILAHPDDEGIIAPLLARWALDEKQRIVNIYITAGQFGTNRVGGNVRGPAFAYLRLTELHWTLDRLGVAMFHSLWRSDRGATDDPAAVLSEWDHERTLRDLTRHLRLLRPQRVLAWFPGPPSSHVDHVAAGGAALLACRAAASPEAFPEQLDTEGLRAYEIPEMLLFYQAERIGYQEYPSGPDGLPASRAPSVEIPVDIYSPSLGRRYTDQAREAMREQRAVGVGMGLARGGPFDRPVRLIRVWGGGPARAEGPDPAASRAAGGLRLSLKGSPAQRFLETVAADARAPLLPEIFPPEVRIEPVGRQDLTVHVVNGGAAAFRGRAVLEAPQGWQVRPSEAEISLPAGASADLAWTILPPADPGDLHAAATLVVRDARGRGERARVSFVVSRRMPGPEKTSPPRAAP